MKWVWVNYEQYYYTYHILQFILEIVIFCNAAFFKDRTIGMLQESASAPLTSVGRFTVVATNTVHELVRQVMCLSVRPRATSQRDDLAIEITHLRNRFRPVTLTTPTYNVCNITYNL